MWFSSLPITTWEGSVRMPSSRAIATAVSIWSPVIITTRMPASWHLSTAALTSGRMGSIMPVRPIKVRPFSMASAEVSSGSASQSRFAQASTRSARSAMRLFSAMISSRSFCIMGRTPSGVRRLVQRARISSGAPLVYWTTPVPVRCRVDIILRMESKGASAMRGVSALRLSLLRPLA